MELEGGGGVGKHGGEEKEKELWQEVSRMGLLFFSLRKIYGMQ